MNIFAIAFAAVMGLKYTAEGGEGTINVSSSREWSVFASNSEPWITVTPGSGTSGSATVKLTVQANSTYESREGEVTVKAGAVIGAEAKVSMKVLSRLQWK